MLLLFVFAFLDIGAALILWNMSLFPVSLIDIVGWAVLLKGLYSVFTGYLHGYYLDWRGWIDLLAGTMLLFGTSLSWIWILPALKGGETLLFTYSHWSKGY